MVTLIAPGFPAVTAYDTELAKTRQDIVALASSSLRNPRDVEKRVRLAYRQYHHAALTGRESDFEAVRRTIADLLRDFGPKEDVCLLKANLDGHFHCLADVKEDLRMCPLLAGRLEARSISADVDFQEGRYEQARAEFEMLIEEFRTWDNLARLALWHSKLGCQEDADRCYVAAEEELTAKEMRSFAWLELQRGALSIGRGRLEKARFHYERAGAAFPGHWRTDEHVAELLALEGDVEKAVILLHSVVMRAPRPELKHAFAELLIFAGRIAEAQPWLDEALAEFLATTQKDMIHYYHHLADFYADSGGQPAEAVKWARKDVALRSNYSTQSALAWALFKNGEFAEGLDWIRLALSSGAQESGIFGTASALFHAAGDPIKGKFYSRAAEEINPRGDGFHMHH
jgi:tetratricopeptide (TPR) repeat protein